MTNQLHPSAWSSGSGDAATASQQFRADQLADADLAGAYARAVRAPGQPRLAWLCHLSGHCRRQRAGGAGASAVPRRTDLRSGEWLADVERRGAAVAILAALYGTTVVIGYCTSAFLGWFGLARRGLLSTALGAAADAAALVAAVACRLARALSACCLVLSLGKNRARAGAKLAAGRPRVAIAIEAGAVSQPVRDIGYFRAFGTRLRRRRYIYFRRSAAASAGFRLRLNGATKRPSLSIR